MLIRVGPQPPHRFNLIEPLRRDMAALDLELNVQAFVSRDDTQDHRPVPRSILLRMPIEILRSVLLWLRDVSVAQAGYTQEGIPSERDIPTTSLLGSSWIAVTHVCVGLREVALAMPELWTIIILENGVASANVFAERSGTMPLIIHADGLRTTALASIPREDREIQRRREVMILAAIPRFGARVSRLMAQGYALSSLQGLVDALDWSSLSLETLSLGVSTRGVGLSLSRAFLDNKLKAPHLTSLHLRRVDFDFAQPWAAFINLRSLSLQFDNQGIATEQHTGVLCTWLKQMPLLEEIALFTTSFAPNIPEMQWHVPVAASHPFLEHFAMTETGCLSWLRSLATEISFPSDTLTVSWMIPGGDVNLSLNVYSFSRLLEYLRQFWGQESATGAAAGLDVNHLPTIRVRDNRVTLVLHRSSKPRRLRLSLIGSMERLLPALRTACQQLLPLYTVEKLRVYWQETLPSDFLSDDSQLLDGCRTLIVYGTDVPGLGRLPRLRELRVMSAEGDDCSGPVPLLRWLRHRDDSGAPRLPLLILEGAPHFQDAEHMANLNAIRLLVGDLRF
jgi:hypothetical protein